jgi:hypothetical protein
MLPDITRFSELTIDEGFYLISASGFEDRGSAVYQEICKKGLESQVKGGIAVEYEPQNTRNRIQVLEDGMASLGISNGEIHWMKYNRLNPDDFELEFLEIFEDLDCDRILLDVSSMSKYLILILIQLLADQDVGVTIFYAEADKYHPTKEEFEKRKEETPEETPAFLTYGVYDVVTARAVSSVAKGSQPIVTIAFPTFNHQELMALISELPAHHLISIEGKPHLQQDRWRRDAIEWVNKEVSEYIHTESRVASTFNYKETFELLRGVYSEYSDGYRIVMAPTGSKMQTVGASLFRRVFDDIQVVYPVTKKFAETYTEGWKECWGIDIGVIDDALEETKTEREQRIDEIKNKIKRFNDDITIE